MHYRQVYYFVRIVEAGSFSQAARTIHVAQPALSQQIAELEASLGIALLQRSPRGIKPTAAGQRFYEQASSILRRYENLPGLVRSSIGEIEGSVSVGMPGSLSTTLVGPFIERCWAAYPKITWKLLGYPDRVDMNRKIYVQRASGGRATLAAKQFKDIGFTNVPAVVMELADWQKSLRQG